MGMHRGLRAVVAGSAIAMLVCTAARAQNLDQGKSAAQLFANGCAACHHGPRGLAKGRIKLQLFMFLKDHYVTNSSEAWALPPICSRPKVPRVAGREPAPQSHRMRRGTTTISKRDRRCRCGSRVCLAANTLVIPEYAHLGQARIHSPCD